MYIESVEIPYDPPLTAALISSVWHEAFPTWCNYRHVIAVQDSNGNQILDFCDWIQLDNGLWYHVTAVATDLELYPEIADIYIPNAVSMAPGPLLGGVLLDTMEVFNEWILPINVTVKNMGTLPLTGSVNGYYSLNNATYQSMGSSQAISLEPCNGTYLTFYWNLKTTGAGKSIYFMKFNVTGSYIGPNQDKLIAAADEFLIKVKVRVLGDVEGDNDVDVGDQRKVQLAMFTSTASGRATYLSWNSFPNFTDMDGDGDVDVGDQRKQQLWMFLTWQDP
jgi:hypothetical protein